eukprot:1138352-Pelagomonas_calceolata.AAC.1
MDVLLCAIGAHEDKIKMRSIPFCVGMRGMCFEAEVLRVDTSELSSRHLLLQLSCPYRQQKLSIQAVFDFLLQHNNKLFFIVSELLDLLLAGKDQTQADQPNSLAEDLFV